MIKRDDFNFYKLTLGCNAAKKNQEEQNYIN